MKVFIVTEYVDYARCITKVNSVYAIKVNAVKRARELQEKGTLEDIEEFEIKDIEWGM